ncbi:alpha/beta fold hydrolase [Deferribacter autotrophicus]|uniref:Alpha/beta fold hydrolase n=1 Tax=Deferribacter autotrophicus TaxID=500465 RepID=A0A5A8F1X7_9BACT|nr:alpha/beta fold hydrolase [Deferribacter autotrophicus]KAA0257315.1 alpha/beta fold hydrolase [Deferribacter autotrophicus]
MVKLVGLKPFKDLKSVDTYELLALDKKRAQSEGVSVKENFPKFLPGNNGTGVLLVHGFTASPYEMSLLADYLNEKGYSVYLARIAGHGSTPKNLNVLTYNDWYESLKYGYFVLKKNCKKLVIIGQSMGALLAIDVAILNGADKVVMLSPALGIKDFGFKLIPLIKNFKEYVINEEFDENLSKYYYPVRPVKGLYQLYLLIEYTWKSVNQESVPIYVILSEYDNLIDTKKVKLFYKKIKTKEKKIDLIKQKSIKHILTLDDNPLRGEIFEKIEMWIREG